RGMGDSSGELRNFEQVSEDIDAALAALRRAAPHADRVAVFGLCDAASAALLHLHDRPGAQVDALCLLNPWVRSEATLARTHLKRYYLQRLTDASFWRRLFSGDVGLVRVKELLQSLRSALRPSDPAQATTSAAMARPPFQAAMARAWRNFRGRTLLVICGDDLTAQEFIEHSERDAAWRGLVDGAGVQRLDLADADHTLSQRSPRLAFETTLCRWLAPAI
ncbi:MAG: hydrolase 1, exosortase A system-associated, partial [Rubrivivax sp.]